MTVHLLAITIQYRPDDGVINLQMHINVLFLRHPAMRVTINNILCLLK